MYLPQVLLLYTEYSGQMLWISEKITSYPLLRNTFYPIANCRSACKHACTPGISRLVNINNY